MFKVSGIWVRPYEIEQVLIVHEDDIEKFHAFLVLKEGRNSEVTVVFKELVKERVGKWNYPLWFDVVNELPKTVTGKMQRFNLREPS